MNEPKTIQVITDITDASYNEMFGVMHSIAKELSRDHIDFAPVTPVQEYSIVQGAFLNRLLVKSYVSPVVLFTNVAPHPIHKSDAIGKIKGKDIIFIGSNNGIFSWLARDYEFEYLAQVNVTKPYIVDGQLIYLPGKTPPDDYDLRFGNKTDYLTFSAHTVLGAIAVALAVGIDYKKFGDDRERDFIIPLEIKKGEIVHIDNYGNAKIYGSSEFPPGTELEVLVNQKAVAKATFIKDRMMSHETNSLVVYPSTSLPNMVDIAIVRGDARKELGLKIEDIVTFREISHSSTAGS